MPCSWTGPSVGKKREEKTKKTEEEWVNSFSGRKFRNTTC